MKRCIVALLLLLGWSARAFAQDEEAGGWDSGRDLDPPRTVSIFMSLGYAEIFGAGVLVQVADRYAIGVVASNFWLARQTQHTYFPDVPAYGVRGTYAFHPDGRENFLLANAFIVDVMYLTPKYWGERYLVANPGGLGIEALVGRDAPLGGGVGILWGFGASAYFISGGRPDYTPAFRLGLHIDI